MKLATKIVGVALIATALCGVGIGTASAAAPVGSHGASTAADAPTTDVMAYQRTLYPGETAGLTPAFTCPTDHPWLVNKKLSSANTVPNGLEVNGATSRISIPSPSAGPGGLASGWTFGYVKNWGQKNDHLTIFAICTNSADAGYKA